MTNLQTLKQEKEITKAIDTLQEANCQVQFQCEKCYEKFTTDECEEHCKTKKHYTFKLLGTNLVRSFA